MWLTTYSSTVWSPDVAREELKPEIQKTQELQVNLLEIRGEVQKNQPKLLRSDHKKEDIDKTKAQLQKIQVVSSWANGIEYFWVSG